MESNTGTPVRNRYFTKQKGEASPDIREIKK